MQVRRVLSLSVVVLGLVIGRASPEAIARSVQDGVTVSGYVRDGQGGGLAGDVTVMQGAQVFKTTSRRTNSNGHYEIAGLSSGPLTIVAKADGYYPATQTSDGAANATINFALVQPISVSGTVTTASGQSISGAKIIAVYPGVVRRVVFDREVTTSDDEGRFTLSHVKPNSRIALEAVAVGYAATRTVEFNVGTQAYPSVAVRMDLSFGVKGRVVDDSGLTITDALVTVRPTGGRALGSLGSVGTSGHALPPGQGVLARRTVESSTGGFEFDGLIEGSYKVIVRKPGHTPQVQSVFFSGAVGNTGGGTGKIDLGDFLITSSQTGPVGGTGAGTTDPDPGAPGPGGGP